ncbi:MAG: hypothetical protein JW704_08955 [Anaerolineaceae bacterium]|nr:hypothetical protein [Anaerolineaceae bacterium]MBN2677793.1 hypothetical protein [Anaerolineaceae bacterium]
MISILAIEVTKLLPGCLVVAMLILIGMVTLLNWLGQKPYAWNGYNGDGGQLPAVADVHIVKHKRYEG